MGGFCMVQAARTTAVCRRLVIVACLLCGLAGCQTYCGRPAWLAGRACNRDATCAGPCSARCVPCGGYQPTVWESWNSGPMAVRCGVGQASAQPDPAWLRDVTKPQSPAGAASPESVPPPPGKASESATPEIGSGFKLQPTHCAGAPAVPYPTLNPGETSAGDPGEGFQLQPGGSRRSSDKPALKGLETPPEGLPALPAPTVPSDKKSAAPSGLVPASGPAIN